MTGDEAQDFLDQLYEEADEGTIDITVTTEGEVTVETEGVTVTSCVETPFGCFTFLRWKYLSSNIKIHS